MVRDEIFCKFFILNIVFDGFKKYLHLLRNILTWSIHYQSISNSIVVLYMAKHLTLEPCGWIKIHTHFTCFKMLWIDFNLLLFSRLFHWMNSIGTDCLSLWLSPSEGPGEGGQSWQERGQATAMSSGKLEQSLRSLRTPHSVGIRSWHPSADAAGKEE